MAKTTSAKEYRKKNKDELLNDLKKLREELQKIRFTKSSGTAVAKLSKIKDLRKQIARILTIVRENRKEDVIKALRERTKKEEKDGKEEEIKTVRFTKQSGTAVAKLSKIKLLRKQIARVLTIIRENKKQEVIKNLRTKTTKEKKDDKEEEVKNTIKNLKMKHIPLDLRPKLTRAKCYRIS